MSYKIAVAGATLTAGREILKTLAERNFPAEEVIALSPGRAGGAEVSYGEEKVLRVRGLDGFDFAGLDLAFFATDAKVSAAHVPRAAASGCAVIDMSGHFHLEPDVPLVVPEANLGALKGMRRRRIVANPSPPVIALAVALKPLHALAKARRVVVATYQSVSGTGKEGMDELWAQTRGVYVNETPPAESFPKQIAFNCIPQVDRFMDDGATEEEWKLTVESRKVIDPDIAVTASCVRVPVFIGDALVVHAEFERPVTEKAAWAALRDAPGLTVLDRREEGGYASQAEIAGEDAVFVSRLRRDLSVPNGLAFWVVSDNLRKGAALNAVQVAEEMVSQGLLD
jgi:aspartate-semialdehyde dehydrogenase